MALLAKLYLLEKTHHSSFYCSAVIDEEKGFKYWHVLSMLKNFLWHWCCCDNDTLSQSLSLVFALKEKMSARLSGEGFTSTLCVSRSSEFPFHLSRMNLLNIVLLCVYFVTHLTGEVISDTFSRLVLCMKVTPTI